MLLIILIGLFILMGLVIIGLMRKNKDGYSQLPCYSNCMEKGRAWYESSGIPITPELMKNMKGRCNKHCSDMARNNPLCYSDCVGKTRAWYDSMKIAITPELPEQIKAHCKQQCPQIY